MEYVEAYLRSKIQELDLEAYSEANPESLDLEGLRSISSEEEFNEFLKKVKGLEPIFLTEFDLLEPPSGYIFVFMEPEFYGKQNSQMGLLSLQQNTFLWLRKHPDKVKVFVFFKGCQ